MENAETRTISLAKERAALLLATGKRARDVALELGVTEQTICRWRKQEAFIDAVAAAGQGIDATIKAQIEGAKALTLECRSEALDVVRKHLYSENPAIALKAAELLLKT